MIDFDSFLKEYREKLANIFKKEHETNTDALDRLSAKVYGPALAPVARIKGRHRLRFLIKSPKNLGLQEAVRNWVATISLNGDVRLVIDLDPPTFY